MDGVASSHHVPFSAVVPLHASDPLNYNELELHVCSRIVPPSHIQISFLGTSVDPLNELKGAAAGQSYIPNENVPLMLQRVHRASVAIET